MKNQYAQTLKKKKAREISQATQEGFDFALNLCAVGLNNLFGFGQGRIARLEKELTRILEEEFGSDMEKASYGLARRIEQIRRDN